MGGLILHLEMPSGVGDFVICSCAQDRASARGGNLAPYMASHWPAASKQGARAAESC